MLDFQSAWQTLKHGTSFYTAKSCFVHVVIIQCTIYAFYLSATARVAYSFKKGKEGLPYERMYTTSYLVEGLTLLLISLKIKLL